MVFDSMDDIFISMESILFIWSALISSIFFLIVVSGLNSDVLIFLPTLFNTHIFSPLFKGCGKFRNVILVFNDFWWKLFYYFRILVSPERRSSFDLRGTSSIPIFFDSSYCLTFNFFNYVCCFLGLWSDLANMDRSLVWK